MDREVFLRRSDVQNQGISGANLPETWGGWEFLPLPVLGGLLVSSAPLGWQNVPPPQLWLSLLCLTWVTLSSYEKFWVENSSGFILAISL